MAFHVHLTQNAKRICLQHTAAPELQVADNLVVLPEHNWRCLCRLPTTVQDNLMETIGAKEQAAKQVSWMDSILSLIPGRKQAASNEPSDEAIKRTHDYLRCPP